MSATPTYDTVVKDLRIDPERIAARPAWSFEERDKALRSASPTKRTRQTAARPRSQQNRAEKGVPKQTRAGQSRTKREAAAN